MRIRRLLFPVLRVSAALAISAMLSACQRIPKSPTHLYFTDHGTQKVQCCELGKWEVEDLIPSCREAFSLKVDSKEQAIFVAEYDGRKLFRCDMAGGSRVDLFDGFKEGGYIPMAMDLDQRDRVVYLYCMDDWSTPLHHVVFRVPYDEGKGKPELFMELGTKAADIIIDSRRRRIYWFAVTNVGRAWCEDAQTEAAGNEFWCAGLKTPEKRTLLIGTEKGIRAVSRAVLDPAREEVYWTQRDAGWENDKVRRSDVRGKNIKDIAWNTSEHGEGCVLVNPHGIALDLTGRKVYWADMNKAWLARTGLQGGKVELVLQIPVAPGTPTYPTALDLGIPRVGAQGRAENP